MPPGEVANRLRGLHRGQWFASLPSEFGVDEPWPFLLESAPIPAGHPESDDPLSSARQIAFDGAMDVVRDRSRLEYGLDIALQSQQSRMARHQTQSTATDATASENMTSDTDSQQAADQNLDARIDSALPHTERLPDAVEYDAGKYALLCANCQNRFDPTIDGMRRVIGFCDSLDAVSRDEVPICELNLELWVDERRQRPYTDAQLRFLQAVHLAHQQAFDEALEYDLVYDSMVRLQEYVGISHSELQDS